LTSASARGYPIDNPSTFQVNSSLNDFAKNIFGSKLTLPNIQGSSLSISRFIPKGSGLTFEDLVNTKNFSTKDISGSVKAIAILFIKLIITTLSVTLGILKLILSLVTKW